MAHRARPPRSFDSPWAADFTAAVAAQQHPRRSIEELTRLHRQMLEQDPFRLAPMAGVTDSIYRSMFWDMECSLATTEMVSVAGLAHESARTWDLIFPAPAEKCVAVQLFGSRPEQFEDAARTVCDRLGTRLAVVDINMACPVPKVFKKGEGCALMGRPDIAAKIVRSTLAGIDGRVPLTVKIRLGTHAGELLAPSFARLLADEGVSAIALHGRYANQLYRGEANWDAIADVARSLEIPLMGSGDVTDPLTAVQRFVQTPVAGVLVARGSYGTPWFFRVAHRLLEHYRTTGELPAGGATAAGEDSADTMLPYGTPGALERLQLLRTHIERYQHLGRHMARIRPLVGWYVKGLPAARIWRGRTMACESGQDYLDLVDQMIEACQEHGLE